MILKKKMNKSNQLSKKYNEEIIVDWDRDIATICKVFKYTPDIVASFSLLQIKKYKSYAYKWDYIDCSQFSGLKPQDYDNIFQSSFVNCKNRKNSRKMADLQMDAIRSLNSEGIPHPSISQIRAKIDEVRG